MSQRNVGYAVSSQAEDKAIRGRNLSADLVAGMAGAVFLPPKAFWLESVKSRGLGRRPISRLVLIPLAGDVSTDLVCSQDEAFRHLRSPLLDSTSQGPDLTIRKLAGMFLSKLPKKF